MTDAFSPDAGEEERYQALRAVKLEEPLALETLIRGLHDDAWRVRKAAADRICKLPSAANPVERLVAVLGERGQTGARNAAAEALALLGPSSVPALLQLLRHADPDQRKFAADILGAIGASDAEGPLCDALSDEDDNVKLSAAEALGRVGGDRASRELEKLLSNESAILKLSALESLTALARPPPLPQLISFLDDPLLRRTAYRSLGLFAQPVAWERICRGLASTDAGVRDAALEAFGAVHRSVAQNRRDDLELEARQALRRLGNPEEVLRNALLHGAVEIRRGALAAAASFGEPSLAAAMAEASEDDRLIDDVTVALVRLGPAALSRLIPDLISLPASARGAIAEALVQVAEPSLVDAFAELSQSEEGDLRLLAARGLGRCHSPKAVPILLKLLPDAEAAPAAIRALVQLSQAYGDKVVDALQTYLQAVPLPAALRALTAAARRAAMPALRRALKAPEATLRAAAVDAAVEVAGSDLLELVRVALGDESPVVRTAAARSLASAAPEPAAPLLRLALADPDPSVQRAAIESVGLCGAQVLAPELTALVGSDDAGRALRAVKALARLGAFSDQAVALSLSQRDPEVLKEALSASAALPEGVRAAEGLLRHGRWDIRAAAARLLEASGTRGSLAGVDAALERESDPFTRDALEAARAALASR